MMEAGKVRGVGIQHDHCPLISRGNQGTQRIPPISEQREKTQAKERGLGGANPLTPWLWASF